MGVHRPDATERPFRRVGGPQSLERAEAVAIEEPLEIRISGEPLAITMRTPGSGSALAAGFLFAEGIIRSREDVGAVSVCGRPGEEGFGNAVEIIPAPGVVLDVDRVEASRRGTLTTSSCGVCGRKSVEDLLRHCGQLPDALTVPKELVVQSPAQLRASQRNFSLTGGAHAAAILSEDGQVLAAFEDVGRHNAVDKAVGALVLAGTISRTSEPPPRSGHGPPALLVVSGRASFEIVQKAAMAQIPVVASVSAASSLAIDLAQSARVTLAAFVRDGAFNCYTHPWRIRGLD